MSFSLLEITRPEHRGSLARPPCPSAQLKLSSVKIWPPPEADGCPSRLVFRVTTAAHLCAEELLVKILLFLCMRDVICPSVLSLTGAV